MSLDIDLPPELERLVLQLVETGRYPSASDVVCVALHLLELEEAHRQALLTAPLTDKERALEELVALGQQMGI